MNFSGAVMGNVGSVQFQIAPWSSLYLFSRSIGPLQCIVNLNYRVLICFTCHFQSGSLFFVYFGFLCLQVSSVSNFYPDTRGQKWSLISAHLFSCVVGREGHYKYHCRVWGVLAVCGPHWFCHSPRQRVSQVSIAQAPGCSARALSQVDLCFLHFPGLSHSGSRVLCKGTDPIGHVFCALPRYKQLRRPEA